MSVGHARRDQRADCHPARRPAGSVRRPHPGRCPARVGRLFAAHHRPSGRLSAAGTEPHDLAVARDVRRVA